jgi:hypothetical protein
MLSMATPEYREARDYAGWLTRGASAKADAAGSSPAVDLEMNLTIIRSLG